MTMFRSSQMPLWSQKETYFSWDVNFKIYFNFTDARVFMKIQVEWNIDITRRDLNLIRNDITLPVSTVVWHTIERMGQLFIYLFYFKQYLVRGAQFSETGLNGAQMKRKNNTKDNRQKMDVQLSITKVLEAQFGWDLKRFFRPNPNLFKSCLLLRARGSIMSQILYYF